jgi:hypothetical protein
MHTANKGVVCSVQCFSFSSRAFDFLSLIRKRRPRSFFLKPITKTRRHIEIWIRRCGGGGVAAAVYRHTDTEAYYIVIIILNAKFYGWYRELSKGRRIQEEDLPKYNRAPLSYNQTTVKKGGKKEPILSFEFVHGTYRFIFARWQSTDANCVEHLPHLHTW